MTAARPGLASRIALVTTGVALIAVLITGLVSIGLVRAVGDTQARRTLGREAELLAARSVVRGALPAPRLRALFTALQAYPAVVRADGSVSGRGAGLLPADVVREVASGTSVDTVRVLGGRRWLLEGRPAADADGGVVLLQPAAAATAELTRPVARRLVVALLAGLAVAALAGLLLARRLAAPLRLAADAADRMAGGRRDVRLDASGPVELARVADALNGLSGALAASEDRQRQFLLSVSHELRTPLTAVRGYAEALADGVVAPADVAGTGTTMLREADRLDRLVSDLLDLARLGADDFRVDRTAVDARGLLDAAAAVWADRCRAAGVQLRVEAPPGPVTVETDPTRVRQILDGLAENALRVTPPGAPMVLALRDEPGWVRFEVRDGGPGLTDDDLAVAFERSALYDRYRGVRRVGTGVGLALVAALAVRLGGRAEAGHAPEGGARFAVRLPVG